MSTSSADRLHQISTELQGILESRVQELVTAMKGAEQATRQIVSSEMEIARYRQIIESLSGEREAVQREAAGLAEGAAAASAERDRAEAERNGLRDEVAAAEKSVAKLREEAKGLKSSADALGRETEDLRSRAGSLEEYIVQMRKMREEALARINAATREAAGGSKE
jgi:chromosome segregation ATPase